MLKRPLSAALAGLAIVALFGAFSIAPEVEIGKAAPGFTLKGIDGKEYSLADFKGKVVVLEWTNPNCPFVQRVYKSGIMTSVQKKYAGKVIWLAINSTHPGHQDHETADDLAKTYNSWGATFTTMLLDPDGSVGRSFDAKTTPHMYIIDKDGKLIYAGGIDDDPRGNRSERVNYVDQALTELFAGKAITTATSRPYGCSVKYSS